MGRNKDKLRRVAFAELAAQRREQQAEIEAVEWLLDTLSASLPAQSPTARAIERGAGWQEILEFARWEGAQEVIGLLEEAIDSLGPQQPPRPRRQRTEGQDDPEPPQSA